MKTIVLPVLVLTAVAFLASTLPVFADDSPALDLTISALQSPGDPPLIPHAVKPDQDGEACNVCHRSGLKNAPATSHPERLNCTSCHIQGEVKQEKKASRKGRKK